MLLIVSLGIVMGVLLGAWLGYQLTSMYTAFFHFPKLIYRVQLWIPLAAAGISLVAAFGGALNTMRNIMQLAPAEAMRPPAPTQFHRMLLERLGLEKFLSPQLRMIIRTLERRPGNAELRRPLDANQHPIAIPPNGVLLTDRLAQKLGIHPGDHLQVEVLEGKRIKKDVLVTGVVNDMFGLSVYMNLHTLNRLLGEGDNISSVAVALDRSQLQAFNAETNLTPKIATVSFKASALQSFEETSARNILVFTSIVTAFAAAIAVGVVYNSARIALAERAWELASLRVLGFTRREVSALLLGELGVELMLAIPFGLWLGYLLSLLLVSLTHTETIAFPVIVAPRTYAKVSALGVEEQRVNVIIDLISPAQQWQTLGDGYRVETRTIVFNTADAVTVPVSALFRKDGQWMVFVVSEGRARLRKVSISRQGAGEAMVTSSLQSGERVVMYPGDRRADGSRVTVR